MNKYEIIKNMKFDANNPNNIRLYHGTTHEGGANIPTMGFAYLNSSIWNCSDDDDYSYFYELNRYIDVEGLEDDEFSYQQRSILGRANEAGQLQEAVLDNPGLHTYILELIVPPEFAEFIEDDVSCDGMEGTGAIQIYNDELNALFKTGEYAMHVYKAEFIPKCAYLYLTGVIDNPFFSSYLTDFEVKVINAIRHSEVGYCEELMDVDINYVESFGKTDFSIYND